MSTRETMIAPAHVGVVGLTRRPAVTASFKEFQQQTVSLERLPPSGAGEPPTAPAAFRAFSKPTVKLI